MARIFISYKRADKEKVFKIKDQIESALGEKCWIDIDGIESDAQFVSVILDARDNAELVLFMYSKEHTKITNYEKDWTIRELNYSSEENKRIVFVNLDGTPLSRWFKFMYGQKQQVNGCSESDIIKLIKDLKKWLGDKVEKLPILPNGTVDNIHNTRTEINKKVRLYLKNSGAAKLQVVKSIKETLGINLKEAKDLVDGAPTYLPSLYDEIDARSIKRIIEEAGASLDIVSAQDAVTNKKVRLFLDSSGPAKLQVVKCVKELFNIGLKEAMDLVNGVPTYLPGLYDERTALILQSSLKESGAIVDLLHY